MVYVDRPAPPVGSATYLPRHALPPVAGASPFSDLGPALPPIGALRATANEAHQLVLILQHSIVTGDHLRAGRTYDKLKALFGSAEPSAEG